MQMFLAIKDFHLRAAASLRFFTECNKKVISLHPATLNSVRTFSPWDFDTLTAIARVGAVSGFFSTGFIGHFITFYRKCSYYHYYFPLFSKNFSTAGLSSVIVAFQVKAESNLTFVKFLHIRPFCVVGE